MSTTDAVSLVVPSRFCGPPGTGNGGWVAGQLAALSGLEGPIEVTLRSPPPLDVDLDVRPGEDGFTTLGFGGAVIAQARAVELADGVVDPVDLVTARTAMSTYAGLSQHPFPGCFVCGTDRPAGDGLGLRPGRTGGSADSPVATAWVPDVSLAAADGEVGAQFVWAALDCPGGWAGDLEARPMVLGRITADVAARPEVGEECVVVGRRLGGEGRKTYTASTAYDRDGRVLGRAESTWIALP
jgi:hypothetical protein